MNIFSWTLLLISLSLVLFAINSFVTNKKEHILLFIVLEVSFVVGAIFIFEYSLAPFSNVISMVITACSAGMLFTVRKMTEDRYLER